MIRHIEHKPEIFEHLNGNDLFYQLYDEDGVYGYGALDFTYHPDCILHLEVTRFNRDIYKNLMIDWLEAREIMKNNDANRVIVNHRSDSKNRLWSKFVMKFGFSEPIKYITTYQEL